MNKNTIPIIDLEGKKICEISYSKNLSDTTEITKWAWTQTLSIFWSHLLRPNTSWDKTYGLPLKNSQIEDAYYQCVICNQPTQTLHFKHTFWGKSHDGFMCINHDCKTSNILIPLEMFKHTTQTPIDLASELKSRFSQHH